MSETTQLKYPIRAGADRKFIRRYLYITIACVGVIFWCIYDLQVKYPSEIERSKTYYEQIKNMPAADQSKEWTRVTKEKGWSMTEPDSIEVIEGHITFQYVIGGVCLIAGIVFALLYVRTLKSWIEADPSGIRSSWGKELTFDQILHINKRKWEKKGLAKIVYKKNKDDEMERTFVIDDLKYERTATDQILETVENALTDDQIVNGRREADVRAERKAESAPVEE